MEGAMPDFSNCVKDKNGGIWCFDQETECVYRVILDKACIYDDPPNFLFQEVLLDLLKAENKKRKKEAC